MAVNKTESIDLAIGDIDPESSTPLYHQIEADLRRLIQQGSFRPGEPLPSEIALSHAYGVGRQTMRLALSRLVADDLIARKAGRGTFLKPQTGRSDFYLDRSFTRQMQDMGLAASSQLLAVSRGIVDETMSPAFHEQIGQPYLHVTRLRYGDGEPIGLQSARILLKQCPDLESVDFARESLYDVLLNRYRLPISQIDHTIAAVLADELQAGLLEVVVGNALLLVRTTAYLVDRQPIEETTSYYRADKYEYHTSHRYQARETP